MERTWQQRAALANLGENKEDAIDDEEMANWYKQNEKSQKEKGKNISKKESKKITEKLIRMGMSKENAMIYALSFEEQNYPMRLFINPELKKQFDNILIDNITIGHYWEDVVNSLNITDAHKAAIIKYYRDKIRQIETKEESPGRGQGSKSSRRKSHRSRRSRRKRRHKKTKKHRKYD